MERRVSLLLVEHDPGAVALVGDALLDAHGTTFHIDRVDRLASAADWLRRRTPGVVLLDLNLPDSRGLDTLVVLRTYAPRTAFVVLTAQPDLDGVRVLQAGAQDFIPKDRFDRDLLTRALRYAVERQTLLNEIETRRAHHLRDEELSDLGAISGRSGPVVSRFFGTRALRQTSKDLFTSLVHRYGDALDLVAADPRGAISEPAGELIGEVGRRLGVLSAGPHDALEIHTMAAEIRGRLVPVDALPAFEDAGGRALVRLLSELAGHYRHYIVQLDGAAAE